MPTSKLCFLTWQRRFVSVSTDTTRLTDAVGFLTFCFCFWHLLLSIERKLNDRDVDIDTDAFYGRDNFIAFNRFWFFFQTFFVLCSAVNCIKLESRRSVQKLFLAASSSIKLGVTLKKTKRDFFSSLLSSFFKKKVQQKCKKEWLKRERKIPFFVCLFSSFVCVWWKTRLFVSGLPVQTDTDGTQKPWWVFDTGWLLRLRPIVRLRLRPLFLPTPWSA